MFQEFTVGIGVIFGGFLEMTNKRIVNTVLMRHSVGVLDASGVW